MAAFHRHHGWQHWQDERWHHHQLSFLSLLFFLSFSLFLYSKRLDMSSFDVCCHHCRKCSVFFHFTISLAVVSIYFPLWHFFLKFHHLSSLFNVVALCCLLIWHIALFFFLSFRFVEKNDTFRSRNLASIKIHKRQEILINNISLASAPLCCTIDFQQSAS